MMDVVTEEPKTRTVCGNQKILDRKVQVEIFTCVREIDHDGPHADGNISWRDK